MKLSLNGEQGQLAKKLIASNVLTRVGMCALGVPGGKKHFLMVCHDKGKVSFVRLMNSKIMIESMDGWDRMDCGVASCLDALFPSEVCKAGQPSNSSLQQFTEFFRMTEHLQHGRFTASCLCTRSS